MEERTGNKANTEAYNIWLERTASTGRPRYVAFVDGDPVESGDNFRQVAGNASMLRSQRGEGAKLAVYDTKLGISA
jgi:hypothetical protein